MGAIRAIWRHRLHGWPAFAAWTVAWSVFWLTASSENETAIGYAFLGLVVVALLASLPALPFGMLGGFGLLLITASLLDPFSFGGLIGGVITLGVAALAWWGSAALAERIRARWRRRRSAPEPGG